MTDPLSTVLAHSSQSAAKASAVSAVLQSAASSNMDEALRTHGSGLTASEHALLKSLSPAEIGALNSARNKLGSLWHAAADTNNNL